jgi:hypothetical protein
LARGIVVKIIYWLLGIAVGIVLLTILLLPWIFEYMAGQISN